MIVYLILFIVVFVIIGILASNEETKKKRQRNDTINQRLNELDNFTVSRKVYGFGGFYIFAIDEANEKIALVTESAKHIVEFSDIIGIEVIENGNTLSKKSATRTISGAIVGGVLAGGVGTIVGGLSGNSTQVSKVSSLYIKILLRSLNKPLLIITCFDSRTMTAERKASIEIDSKVESYTYGKQNANIIKDLVSVIIDKNDNKPKKKYLDAVIKPFNSIADDLLKLNELRVKGILTEDEFILQKNKILNSTDT